MTSRRVATLAAALLVAAYLPFAPARLHDWRAFYCAGRAVAAHADPYREEPLGTCERSVGAPLITDAPDAATVPAPLPGYALAVFALLSGLPFAFASAVWLALSVVALGAATELLARALGVARATIGVVVVLPATVVAVPLGQPEPFVIGALGAAALALSRGRPRLAGIAVLGTFFDPSVALAVSTALAVGAPRARPLLAGGVAALALVSVAALGPAATVEYVMRVLPAHAAANVAERSQFSATHFAWVLGAPPDAALVLGRVWYAAAAAGGVWAALRLRVHGEAALVLVPAAFAVFGGLYVHYSQLILALPAFAWLAARGRARTAVPFALAVPWLALAAFPPAALALPVLARRYADGLAGVPRRTGVVCALLLLALFTAALVFARAPDAPIHVGALRDALVEDGWRDYVATRDAQPSPLLLVVQLPTVAAFVAAWWSLLRSAVNVESVDAR